MGDSQNRGTPFIPQINQNPPKSPQKGYPYFRKPPKVGPEFLLALRCATEAEGQRALTPPARSHAACLDTAEHLAELMPPEGFRV